MSTILCTLAWTALQVTLLGLIPLIIYLVPYYRSEPRGSVWATTFLLLSLALTLLAFFPVPSLWSLKEPQADAPQSARPFIEAEMPDDKIDTDLQPSSAFASPPGGARFRISALVRKMQPSRSSSSGNGWLVVGGLLALGIAIHLGRFLAGLWAVSQCCRRSLAVTDPRTIHVLEYLRSEMQIRRIVRLRQTASLKSPAQVGWLRPMILLPMHWQGWTAQELQAVLAHELAHVARWDYLWWILGRLSVCIHFYHPLVRWMTHRLHCEQEWQADATASQIVGGSQHYLIALSGVILRQDHSKERLWAVRSFVPSPV